MKLNGGWSTINYGTDFALKILFIVKLKKYEDSAKLAGYGYEPSSARC